MKKTILPILLLMLPFVCGAQSLDNLSAGAKLGYNMSWNTCSNSLAPKSGIVVGAYGEYDLTDLCYGLYGRAELLYNHIGYKGHFDDTRYKVKFNYISIPLLAQAKFYHKTISAMAGPQIGFNLGGRERWIYPNGDKESTSWYKVDNVFDLSLVVGASCRILYNVDLDVRYAVGLLNVYHHSDILLGSHNHVVSIGLNYKIF